jgi:hypothetical protein
MDAEGFGICTNHGEYEAGCPAEIGLEFIARLNRDYLRASLFGRGLRTTPSAGGDDDGEPLYRIKLRSWRVSDPPSRRFSRWNRSFSHYPWIIGVTKCLRASYSC